MKRYRAEQVWTHATYSGSENGLRGWLYEKALINDDGLDAATSIEDVIQQVLQEHDGEVTINSEEVPGATAPRAYFQAQIFERDGEWYYTVEVSRDRDRWVSPPVLLPEASDRESAQLFAQVGVRMLVQSLEGPQ